MHQFCVPYSLYVEDQFHPGDWTIISCGSLDFTDVDLAHALFVTGREPGREFLKGTWLGLWEYVSRFGFMRAYIQNLYPLPSLLRTSLAKNLDPTEKSYLSYTVAQALTGIFCERILRVERMLHVDLHSNKPSNPSAPYIKLNKSGPRPDLFGYGKGYRVIAESKGRSTASPSKILELGGRTKKQLFAVKSINGVSSKYDWRIGVITDLSAKYFTKLHIFVHPMTCPNSKSTPGVLKKVREHYLKSTKDDTPEESSTPLIDNIINTNHRFIIPHFMRFRSLLAQLPNAERDGDLLTIRLADIGVTVGVVAEVADILSSATEQTVTLTDLQLVELSERIDQAIRKSQALRNRKIFSDGSFFETGPPGGPAELLNPR